MRDGIDLLMSYSSRWPVVSPGRIRCRWSLVASRYSLSPQSSCAELHAHSACPRCTACLQCSQYSIAIIIIACTHLAAGEISGSMYDATVWDFSCRAESSTESEHCFTSIGARAHGKCLGRTDSRSFLK